MRFAAMTDFLAVSFLLYMSQSLADMGLEKPCLFLGDVCSFCVFHASFL